MERTEREYSQDVKDFHRWYRLRPAAYGLVLGAPFALLMTPFVDPSKINAKVAAVAAIAGLGILGLVLLIYLVERHRSITHELVAGYVEDLRGYTVENIKALRGNTVTLAFDDAVHGHSAEVISLSGGATGVVGDVPRSAEPPPEHVPTILAERGLSQRERNTLLKIIYGMAVAEPYRFDPDAKRGDAAPIIASATDAADCSVSDDTVRKWLKEAAKVAR